MVITKEDSKILKKYMIEKEITVKSLALKAELHYTTMSLMLNGKKDISKKNLVKVSNALPISKALALKGKFVFLKSALK